MLKIKRFHSKSERFHTLQRMLNKSAFTLLQNEHSDKIRAFSLFYKTSTATIEEHFRSFTATKKEHFRSLPYRAQRQNKSVFTLLQTEHSDKKRALSLFCKKSTATKKEHFRSFAKRAQRQKKSISTLS